MSRGEDVLIGHLAWNIERRTLVKLVLRPVRVAAPVFGAALALLGLIASPAAVSASLAVRLNAYYGDCSFGGTQAGSQKTIKIVWRDRDGDAKSIQTVKSNSAGLWSIKCEYDEFVETRDTVKATIGTTSRTFVVPQLTLHIDRSK